MADNFKKFYSDLDSPAKGMDSVTPSDDTELSTFSRALYFPVSGNAAIVTVASWEAANEDANTAANSAIIVPVSAGLILPIRAAMVLSTGTDATNIFALY